MAKKETTDFSDKMIHEMMMNDIPLYRLRHTDSDELVMESKSNEVPPKPEPKASNKANEKAARKIEQFKELYLVPQRIRTRSAVYIDYELQSLIKSYIWTIAPNVSISAYITNILKHHVNTYHAEINEIRRTRFEEVMGRNSGK